MQTTVNRPRLPQVGTSDLRGHFPTQTRRVGVEHQPAWLRPHVCWERRAQQRTHWPPGVLRGGWGAGRAAQTGGRKRGAEQEGDENYEDRGKEPQSPQVPPQAAGTAPHGGRESSGGGWDAPGPPSTERQPQRRGTHRAEACGAGGLAGQLGGCQARPTLGTQVSTRSLSSLPGLFSSRD